MTTILTPGSRADQIRQREEGPGGLASEANLGTVERLASGFGGAAMVLEGIRRRDGAGALMAAAGAYLAYRGASGHCALYESLGLSTLRKGGAAHHGVKVRKTFTINRPPEECYAAWRRFEDLPRFMDHLHSVENLEGGRSRWTARAPLGAVVSWDAEILNDVPGELISWRSVKGSAIDNAGSVSFRPGPAGRGTEVTVELNYEPPGGAVGASVAWLLGEEPRIQVEEDLRRFKQVMETGETPTVQGQPSCRGRD
jgi:uncharacterized membrane protein